MHEDETELEAGGALFAAGELARAEAVLRPLGARNARLLLGRVLLASGRVDEAWTCLREADRMGSDAHSLFHMGECLMARGDSRAAGAAFREATDHDPGLVDAYVLIGQLQVEANQPDQAILNFEEALRRHDTHLGARYYLAETLVRVNELVRATTHLHYLLGLAPDYGPAVVLKGDIAFHHGDFRQAVVEYVRAVPLGAVDAPIYHRLGQAYARIGDALQACKAFDRAIKADPAYWASYGSAGALCESQRWFNRAQRYYEALAYVAAHRNEAAKGLARVEAGLALTGLEGIDPPGAPDDQYEYKHGPFRVPITRARSSTGRLRGSQPIIPRSRGAQGTAGVDGYGTTPEAGAYLAAFWPPEAQRPTAPKPELQAAPVVPPAPTPAPLPPGPGSPLLKSLQAKLRDSLKQPPDAPA